LRAWRMHRAEGRPAYTVATNAVLQEVLRARPRTLEQLRDIHGVGPALCERHGASLLETLEQLESAANDGRLQQLGFGTKRLTGVRSALVARLERGADITQSETVQEPPIDELLDIDREYRERAQAGELRVITPRRFNPERVPWLPILHTERGARHYTALFSNTARAHRLGKTRDWVVLYCEDGPRAHQWTIITSAFGPLRGRRIVRGRERECAARYGRIPTRLAPDSRAANPNARAASAGRQT